MTKYNFDQIIERKNTDSLKFGVLKERFGRDDLIPLWVADMDFQSPPELVETMIERSKNGIFGYPFVSKEYFQAIINWQWKQHQWKIDKEEISYLPGIVKGIAFIIDVFTEKGDQVIIQPPVYHPFRIVTQLHEREVVNNPLILDGNQYKMDFEGLEKIITDKCKLLLLSNPHNPGGRVWNKDELKKLAEICSKNNILVVSDEIHSDLVLNGNKHTPFATVSNEAEQNSITLNAPSKTFNIAGLVTSYSIIKNKNLRERYHQYLISNELNQGSIFSYLTLQVAYEKGEEWMNELKTYIEENIKFVDEYLKTHSSKIKVIIPEASFLIWLDCRELKLSQKELNSLFINKAHLALNDGAMFGKEGNGFMRMNVGCPRSTLEKAIKQLVNALN
ncbi:MalY/PatB family protein [Apibacter sp.]|uniref:MalY/PatB family protein n=1 Tax=Apibacter sp. TaxID=2023709 RepID=UPI0025FD70D8|nr:MalY/PatB family protein [Apibacter sp.]MCT6869257.1 pyridoxal phosphate-dependent aminotransferase [Apibacter sp.]